MAAVHPGALATGALQKEEEEELTFYIERGIVTMPIGVVISFNKI
jgi:hypothetical protein